MKIMRTHTQSGSAFFIILIAIFMFAGLSYALLQGNRTSQANLTSEQARIAAEELINMSNTVQKAVQAMRLRGVSETQFDFSNSAWKRNNGTAISQSNGSCTSTNCKIFTVGGGNVIAQAPSANVKDPSISNPSTYWTEGHSGPRTLRIKGIGSDTSAELVLVTPFIKKEICTKINDLLGIANPSNSPPVDGVAFGSETLDYDGTVVTFPEPGSMGIGDQATGLISKSQFCAYNSTSPVGYYLYTVLIAR